MWPYGLGLTGATKSRPTWTILHRTPVAAAAVTMQRVQKERNIF